MVGADEFARPSQLDGWFGGVFWFGEPTRFWGTYHVRWCAMRAIFKGHERKNNKRRVVIARKSPPNVMFFLTIMMSF
jgi:hypothetical protein